MADAAPMMTNPVSQAASLRAVRQGSLASLKTFPLDRLKIDRAFVRGLPDDRNDQAISRAVVALGHSLNMEVLAEGVETQEQGIFLRAAGCQLFQGNFYGEPMSGDHLMAHIRCGALSLEQASCSSG